MRVITSSPCVIVVYACSELCVCELIKIKGQVLCRWSLATVRAMKWVQHLAFLEFGSPNPKGRHFLLCYSHKFAVVRQVLSLVSC